MQEKKSKAGKIRKCISKLYKLIVGVEWSGVSIITVPESIPSERRREKIWSAGPLLSSVLPSMGGRGPLWVRLSWQEQWRSWWRSLETIQRGNR